jgi:transcriptional regulator with XRE-family HTH domain
MPPKARRNWRTRTPQAAFGIVLRQLREKAGYSQDSFAHATGYHRNYIGQLERGEKSPSLSALFNLSQALDRVPSQMLPLVEKQLGLAK